MLAGSVNPFYHRIYRVVGKIPKGRVATYGLVARLAGRPGPARTVGWALSALPDDPDVPWSRVPNPPRRISLRAHDPHAAGPRPLFFAPGVKVCPRASGNLAGFWC